MEQEVELTSIDMVVSSVNHARMGSTMTMDLWHRLLRHPLWHRRLSHAYPRVLSQVLSSCDMRMQSSKLSSVCSSCQLGKNFSYSIYKTMYTSPFELVVSNLWGPTHVSSEGCFYYITFVYAYSMYTWMYLLRNKPQGDPSLNVSITYLLS